MYKATLAIKPMNNGQMVITYKGGGKRKPNKPKTVPIIFGHGDNAYTWSDKMIVECCCPDGGLLDWLETFFSEFGIRDADMSDFQIDDNKTYFEAICWGEHKNVHFWFEVEEL